MKTEDFIKALAKEGAKKQFAAPSKVTFLWLFLILVYFGGLIALFGLRLDISDRLNHTLFVAELLGMFVTAIFSLWAASLLALPDVNQKPWVRFLPFIPLTLFVGILLYGMFTTEHTLSECTKIGPFDCLISLFLSSVLPGTFMFYIIHKAAPIRCNWAGAMVGLSTSGFGYVSIRLMTQNDDPVHLLLWHFMPVMAVLFLGMLVGKYFLTMSSKSRNVLTNR